MATILKTFGEGGKNYYPSNNGTPSMATVLRDIADDLAALRTGVNATTDALNTLATKLNADAGVTDTNYVNNTATVAALKTIKG